MSEIEAVGAAVAFAYRIGRTVAYGNVAMKARVRCGKLAVAVLALVVSFPPPGRFGRAPAARVEETAWGATEPTWSPDGACLPAAARRNRSRYLPAVMHIPLGRRPETWLRL